VYGVALPAWARAACAEDLVLVARLSPQRDSYEHYGE
jgi:hypothetical protein